MGGKNFLIAATTTNIYITIVFRNDGDCGLFLDYCPRT
jgi:hypothetical protein